MRPMRTFAVVPHKPIHENDIELFWLQKLMSMEIHKLFLNRSVESLTMGVHFRGSRIGVVMREMEFLQCFCKVFLEFRTIVCENILKRNGEHHTTKFKELCCSL